MDKQDIKKLFEKYFKYVERYPDIVLEFRNIRNLGQYLSNSKESFELLKPKINTEVSEDNLINNINNALNIFQKAEEEIAKDESKINYDYPTYLFDTDKVLDYAKNLTSLVQKRNYLKYILKEYKNHLLNRNTKYKQQLTFALIQNPNIMSDMISAFYLLKEQNREKLNYIFMPENIRTFEERIKDELIYYVNLEDEAKIEETTITIDQEKLKLTDLITRLADTKSIEITDPKKLINIIYSFFNLIPPDDLIQKGILKHKRKNEKKAVDSQDDEYLTIAEVEKILKVKRTTIYKLRKAGKLPYIDTGRRVLIRKSDLESYINDNSFHLR
ncbi:helix-turn-helix domain-containing protein [Bacteroidota bacterium]